MHFLRLLFPVAVILLSGCATTGTIPPPPPYVQTLEAKGVAPATLQRIKAARVLTFGDVLELVKKGVPGDKIVAYLKATRAPYAYSQNQVNTLVDAGADSTLVNYVGHAAGDLLIDSQNEPQQQQVLRDAKWQKEMWNDPYFTDDEFWGPPPFGFGWPGIWY